MLRNNRFYAHLSEKIVVEVDTLFSVHNDIIGIANEPLSQQFYDVDNVVVACGKGVGSQRLEDAIDEAVRRIDRVAAKYDLFSADRVMVKVTGLESHPLLLSEMLGMVKFANHFDSSTNFLWGVSELAEGKDVVTVHIVASNLRKTRR